MNMPLDQDGLVTDDELLAAFAKGDREAARALNLRLTPRTFALANRMLRDRAEAEDVTQEAMLRLWKMAPDWEPGNAKVYTWLYRVTVNLCNDRLRKKTAEPLPDGMDPVDETPGREADLTDKERVQALYEALDELPERQRHAIVLRHLEEMGNPEISDVMGIGVEAVESLVARGKRGLKQILGKRKKTLGYTDE